MRGKNLKRCLEYMAKMHIVFMAEASSFLNVYFLERAFVLKRSTRYVSCYFHLQMSWQKVSQCFYLQLERRGSSVAKNLMGKLDVLSLMWKLSSILKSL